MSMPGYPFYLSQSYSYPSMYHSGPSGADFPGVNAGSFYQFWRDRHGEDTPGWPHVIRDNGYMTVKANIQGAKGMFYDFRHTDGSYATGGDSNVVKAFGSNAATAIMDISWPSIVELYGIAREKVINRLIDNTKNSKINVAQFIAERHQTANLVASTARRLAESMLALRRGDLKHAIFSLTGNNYATSKLGRVSRMGGGIPQQWLALQYGWKPLLQDLYGSCEELANLTTGNPPVLSVKGTGSASKEGSYVIHGGGGNPGWSVSLSQAQARGNASIHAGLSSSLGEGMSRTGLVNPYSTAWELLPYSFVVDWFVPVGNYLNRLDYETGLVFQRGWLNMKVQLAWSVRAIETSTWPNGFTSGSWDASSFTANVDYFQREALSSFPMPSTPHFKDPFSLTHVANALSLLATAFDLGSGRRVR